MDLPASSGGTHKTFGREQNWDSNPKPLPRGPQPWSCSFPLPSAAGKDAALNCPSELTLSRRIWRARAGNRGKAEQVQHTDGGKEVLAPGIKASADLFGDPADSFKSPTQIQTELTDLTGTEERSRGRDSPVTKFWAMNEGNTYISSLVFGREKRFSRLQRVFCYLSCQTGSWKNKL